MQGAFFFYHILNNAGQFRDFNDPTRSFIETGGHAAQGGDEGWVDMEGCERREHYSPRVAEALTRMVGMGFTDDEGWLTQLLILKHGDISQVS